MSSAVLLSPQKYRLLMGKMMPVAIQTDEEYERMLAAVERLMEKGDQLSKEEGRILKLMAILVEEYERRRFPLPKTPPNAMLEYLLEEKELKPSDLWPLLGSKSRVSEILSGKRAISKMQAKKLARFFRVTADLFI